MQRSIQSLMNLLFPCAFIGYSYFCHDPCDGTKRLPGWRTRVVFPLKSVLRQQIYFEALLKPVKMFGRSRKEVWKTLLRNLSNFWPGDACRVSRPGARRAPSVSGTGGRLVCRQKTCVCTCLWQVLRCDRLPSSSPDVRRCPIYRGGSSPTGDVAASTAREVPYPGPFNLLHLARAVLGCETVPSEGASKSNLAFLL